MIQLQEYNVYYTKKSNKQGVYVSKCALCPDGAEEACRLDIKGIKTIDSIERVIRE